MEEVKRFERRRSIETRKERSPRVEEKESTMVEAKKVTRRKEEELLIVEEQRRPVISSPHSGFPTGFSSRKLYLFQFPSFCKALAKIVFSFSCSGDKGKLPNLTVAKNRPIKTSVSLNPF